MHKDKKTIGIIKEIENCISQIDTLEERNRSDPDFVRWHINTVLLLKRTFGESGTFTQIFLSQKFASRGPFIVDVYDMDLVIEDKNQQEYVRALEVSKGILQSAIDYLDKAGIEGVEYERGSQIDNKDKSIFISHGKHTKALDKVERFVRTLGFNPVIVKYEPSEGKDVDDLVEEKMSECICVIILATCDDQVEGYFQPRSNVIHEIGMAQEKLKNKIIYLKEEGCKFPSNINPKIWENFTQENMENAFQKITKELRAFKFI